MKRSLILFLLFHLSTHFCKAQQVNILWNEADQAFNDFDLKSSAAILRSILQHPQADKDDSAKVYRTLAARDWQFYDNYPLAQKRLDSAIAIPVNGNATYVTGSGIAAEAGHYAVALAMAEKALSLANSGSEKRQAAIAYAQTVYLSSKTRKKPDTLLLQKAGQLLEQVLQSMPGYPQAAKLLVGIGIIRKDGQQLLTGWNAYFHFSTADSAYPYLKSTANTLATILPHWKGNQLPNAENEQLVQALARSGFYEYIALIAGHSGKDILAYAKYLQETETLTNNYYRQLALGQRNDSLYERDIMALCSRLLKKLQLSPGQDTLTFERFLSLVQPRFGTMGFLGTTSSFHAREICLGHIVNVTHKEVQQYGYKGSLTFIQIDLMYSNGFISWFSSKKRRNGGWSVNDTIYQVREAYITEPMEAWALVTDSTMRRERLRLFDRVMTDSPLHDTTTILNGIGARLRMDALDSLYTTLYRDGLRGTQLQLAFMNAFEEKQQDASIFAHEGRHSIDQIHFKTDFDKAAPREREYRAKLSEIACADFPVFLLGKIISTIGPSGHGMANRMILEDALVWLGKHHEEINGYTAAQPAIKQLYLLSDKQIRTCFREVDPLNKQ